MPAANEAGPLIASRQVRLAEHPLVLTDSHGPGAPSVTLRREGDLIREIHIRCGCGELIVLDCDYAAAISAKPGGS